MRYEDLQESHFQSSSGKIFYKFKEAGDTILIFLHGLGYTNRTWLRPLGYLPDKYSVYLIDLLGHGDSDKPKIDYNVNVQIEVLKEFIQKLKGKIFLIGHSYGGWVCAEYVAKHYSVNGIVLEAPGGLKENFEERIKNREKDYINKTIKEFSSVNNNEEYVIRSILHSIFLAKENLDYKTLSDIKTRCLIIWGERDGIIESKYAKIFNREIKNSKLKIINGAGHSPHYTNSEEFIKIILDFVEKSD